jgi:hypothetical protein
VKEEGRSAGTSSVPSTLREHTFDVKGFPDRRVAGLGDISASKEWAIRPKDREALPELHALYDRAVESESPDKPR